MSPRPNASNNPYDLAFEDASIRAMERRIRQRRQDRWVFATFLILLTLVMSGVYGYFRYVDTTAVDLDLRLTADARALKDNEVLTYAEVVDARTGQIREVKGVYLELWREGELQERWPVRGAVYRTVRMGEVPLTMRLQREMEGPVQSAAEFVVQPGPPAVWRDRRGGMYAPQGMPGLRPVRRESACGWVIDAVPYGGVPIANVPTPLLVRVSDGAGRAVETTLRIESRGEAIGRVSTDAEGFAETSLHLDEFGYIEVHAECSKGGNFVGFEAQPVFDGLGVTQFWQDARGVGAEIFDLTQRQGTRYDVRCDGMVRDYGVLPEDGTLRISKDHFEGVVEGAPCILQVFRGTFSASAPRTARVFQWGVRSLGWDWARQADGVGREGLNLHARSMDTDSEAIAAWKRSGYRSVRVGIATALALSLLLWFAFVMWGFRRRRLASRAQGVLDTESSHVAVSTGLQSILWSGWVAMIVAYGGLYVVLMLMGL